MTDFQGKRILILEGYARQCLPFMRSFKAWGCHVTLLCNSRLDLGYASRLPDQKLVGVCDPDRPEESESYICHLIETGGFDLVVPMVDFSAGILAKNKTRLCRYSEIASNDAAVFDASQDKLSVMMACMALGIPCPKTLESAESVQAVLASSLRFPLVVKPRRGCGAKGFHCYESEAEFTAAQPALSGCVVQEYIPQTNRNLSTQLFIGDDGQALAAFAYRSCRWYPLKGGTGTLNQLVQRPDAVESTLSIARHFGLRGWIGADFIDDPRDHTAKLIEINPRILACAQIGFDAGVDMGLMLLQQHFGGDAAPQIAQSKPRYVRMSQTDVLWLLKSPDRFRAEPSWFCLKDTKDQTFRWDDPLPWFAFLIRGMKNYNKEMEKRK